MFKRFAVGLVALLFVTLPLLVAPAQAQGISQKVAVCNPLWVNRCVSPDANGATPVTIAGQTTAASPSADASGTVTLGGTYQTVFAASTTRKGCSIQNPTTATEILNVRVGAAAVYTFRPGGAFNCASPGVVISDIITVTAATTGHAFTATSQ